MEAIFQICCGSGDEKHKPNAFLESDDTQNWNADDNNIPHRGVPSPKREKAAVALELKRMGRESIFSCPVDVMCEWRPPIFEDKSNDDEEFLRTAMKEHILFQELSDQEMDMLVRACERVEHDANEKVVRQNIRGEYLFIVQEGKLELYCEVNQNCKGILDKGKIFGELALLYGREYALTVVTTEKAILWRLEQSTFRNVVARHTRERDADIMNCLRKVDLFQNLTEHLLRKFAETLTRVRFQEGDIIVRKGDVGETFYIIESGSVKVHDIGRGDSVSSEQVLTTGDSFGERSLLTGEPRAASVTALTDVVTLAMDRITFEKNIGELQELIDLKARQQSLKSLPIFSGAHLTDLEFESLAESMTEVCYLKGTKLSRIGEPHPKNVWFIRKGQVIVYGSKTGKIYNLLAGDYFGEKGVLSDPDRLTSHEAVCEDKVTAWVLSRDSIEAVVGNLEKLGQVGDFVKSKSSSSSIKGLRDLKKHHVLGQGGFGKVWLIESKVTGEPLAMKVINKRQLLNMKQERSILREKELLGLLQHPFILGLVASFQDASNLYLVLPLIQGGELFSVVASKAKNGRGLPNNAAAFYAAGVMEALGHFHHRYIAYRDVKLENVMIDSKGFPKIVDLGFARVIVDKSFTFCGTPEYLAPEIIMAKGHNHTVDYWSFGVLVYEMLVGRSPFKKYDEGQMDMFKRIVLVKYDFPLFIQPAGQDVIRRLLVRQVSDRLGAQRRGHVDIVTHSWFEESGIDLKKLVKGQIDPPWVPSVKDPFDASNFDYGEELANESSSIEKPLSQEEQAIFKDF